MKKKFLSVVAVVMACSMLFGCSTKKSANEAESTVESTKDVVQTEEAQNTGAVRVAALKGPTAMGMVKMMDDDGGAQYDFSIVAAVDEITPKIVKGDVDIAAVPANLASVLYNNTKGEVEVLAINTLGVLYIAENGDSVQSVADLKGKTIYSSGKGATPEYALNYMLSANGIDPEKDVTIEWKSEHSECVAAIAEKENGIAMLPQPFLTTAQLKNDKIRVAIDLTKEWETVSSRDNKYATLITGVVVARKGFVEENKEAVSAFLDKYKESVEYVNANNDDAATLIEKFDIVPAAVAKKALPSCNITFIAGDEMQKKLSGYLSILSAQNPNSVGGALPNEDFYFKK